MFDTEQTSVEASEVFFLVVPPFGSVALSDEHRARLVCGIAAYLTPDVAASPDPADRAVIVQPFGTWPLFVDLVEFGTMVPRLKRVPYHRICSQMSANVRVAAGLSAVSAGVQPFRLAYGPAIDLAASRVYNTGPFNVAAAIEVFFR